jgi:hypothetical protein
MMANVDFIDVTGPASLDELVARTSEALGTPAEPGDSVFGHQYAIDLGPDAVALLRADPAVTQRGYEGAPYLVLIDRIGEYPETFHHARRVYEALAADTPWELALGSDDEPEDIVETCPALQPQD